MSVLSKEGADSLRMEDKRHYHEKMKVLAPTCAATTSMARPTRAAGSHLEHAHGVVVVSSGIKDVPPTAAKAILPSTPQS